ncbi:MAG: cytochrome C biogenesis protein CcsB [Gracilibacter sp. BRH_c7a]|nr:MAG: cytochrome C biogenesis protein CcsB [Gracilibacter sp. BRH_c7a]
MTVFINEFVYLTIALYLLASVIYFLSRENLSRQRIAQMFVIAGFLANSLALFFRAMLVGRLPLTNGAEFILWFTWFTMLLYLFYEIRSKSKGAGGAVALLAALLVATIPLLMGHQLSNESALMPALKSHWLISHVLTAMFSYGSFAVAAGISAVQLTKRSTKAEYWIHKIVTFGFVMLTLAIVLGAIWAEQAWGRYWSWDPKETWALVTWIIYAIYFHLHRQEAWKEKRANLLVVGGFILVLFTFFGVNYLLSGLHSYS